ncbi:hypothetical protein ACFXTO_035429 [Malus domestica]
MPGIDPEIISAEVDRLLEVGFIHDVWCPTWVSNVVVVGKKEKGKWRMLILVTGYNQIHMAVEDQEKTAFITERGLYCYTVMPFGLKNAGSTYQSRERCQHIDHLRNTFDILRRYNMRLNPAKCAFDVSSGQFLGHIVNKRGIEPNPAKVEALCNMPDPPYETGKAMCGA